MMGKPASPNFPIAVPLPLVLVGVDLAEPSMRGGTTRVPVAIDVGDSDSVAILLTAADVMHFGFGAREIDPSNAG